MIQGKAETCQRFSSARGNRERENSLGTIRRIQATRGYLSPKFVNFVLAGKLFERVFQTLGQRIPAVIAAMLTQSGGRRFRKISGIGSIGINKTTEQEPGQKANHVPPDSLVLIILTKLQNDLLNTGNQIGIVQKLSTALNDKPFRTAPSLVIVRFRISFKHSPRKLVCSVWVYAINETRMMGRNTKSKNLGGNGFNLALRGKTAPNRLSTGSGVVYRSPLYVAWFRVLIFRHETQVLLEGIRVFAEIV